MWFPAPCCAIAAPLMAVLSDSVPPLVKTISLDRQPRTLAMESREASMARWHSWARAYMPEALKNFSVK